MPELVGCTVSIDQENIIKAELYRILCNFDAVEQLFLIIKAQKEY